MSIRSARNELTFKTLSRCKTISPSGGTSTPSGASDAIEAMTQVATGLSSEKRVPTSKNGVDVQNGVQVQKGVLTVKNGAQRPYRGPVAKRGPAA